MIRILHLYHDLLDLYGDGGNLMAVTYYLDNIGQKYTIDRKSLYDDIDFTAYDFVYIGTGKDSNINIIAEDFRRHGDNVRKAIENGVTFLVIGNSRLLFGQYFEDGNGNRYEGIGLFPYYGIQSSKVFICDDLMKFNGQEMYGFINRSAQIMNNESDQLFELITGKGDNNDETVTEGNLYNNFIGTWMLGPLLIKNPSFLKEVMKRILKDSYVDLDIPFLEEAHEKTIEDMHKK